MAGLNANRYPSPQEHLLDPPSPHVIQVPGMSRPTHRIHRKPAPSATHYQQVAINEILNPKETGGSQSSIRPESHTRLSSLSVWWQELLACFLVVASFAAIVITLVSVKGKPLPRLPFHISLNTLVAIFAAILKLAAAFILAEGLSQSKWSWYMRPRRLHDFQVYDNASRGPWGAAQLLWYLRCRPMIASLGAFVTIATTLVDPLSQQLIKIIDCPETVPNETTGLPRTHYFNEVGAHLGAAQNEMSTGFVGSIATGQFSHGLPQVPFSCPTGNCTFEPGYSSVGYCSSCIDVSERLIFDKWYRERVNLTNSYSAAEEGITIRLPNPLSSTTDLLKFNISIKGQQQPRFAMNYWSQNVNMIWYDTEQSSSGDDVHQAHAAECSLDPCIHTFDGKVVNGSLSEQTVQRGPIFPWYSNSNGRMLQSMADLSCIDEAAQGKLREIGYNFTAGTRWLPYNVTIDPTVPESDDDRYIDDPAHQVVTEKGLKKGFYVGNSTAWRLSDTARRIVPSECVYQINLLVRTSLDIIYFLFYFNGSVMDNFYEEGVKGPLVPTAFYNTWALDHGQNGTFETLQMMMQNITDSMTTYMRWHGNENMSESALGEVSRYTVCVRVRWPYIAFNAAIVGLLLLFFIATVFDTRLTEGSASPSAHPDRTRPERSGGQGHHDFKSSALATIFHGLDKNSLYETGHVGSSNTVSELESFSKERLVTLVLTEHGWKLATVSGVEIVGS